MIMSIVQSARCVVCKKMGQIAIEIVIESFPMMMSASKDTELNLTIPCQGGSILGILGNDRNRRG